MSFELGVRTAPGMKTADRFRYHRISFRIRLHCGNCDRGYWWEGLFVTNTAIAMSHNEGSGPRRLNPTFSEWRVIHSEQPAVSAARLIRVDFASASSFEDRISGSLHAAGRLEEGMFLNAVLNFDNLC
jgi:hypothetical protein